MDKQAVLEEIYQSSFENEMEKISKEEDYSILGTALGLAGAGGAAYGGSKLYKLLQEKKLRQLRAARAGKALKLLGLLGAGAGLATAGTLGVKNPEIAKKMMGSAKYYSTILKERMTPSYTGKTIAAIRKFRKI